VKKITGIKNPNKALLIFLTFNLRLLLSKNGKIKGTNKNKPRGCQEKKHREADTPDRK
jgi:hypothetical protein